jgi:hypothetical protein
VCQGGEGYSEVHPGECSKLRGWIIEQKLFQLTIEAERQRQLCEGIKEVRETIDATKPMIGPYHPYTGHTVRRNGGPYRIRTGCPISYQMAHGTEEFP